MVREYKFGVWQLSTTKVTVTAVGIKKKYISRIYPGEVCLIELASIEG